MVLLTPGGAAQSTQPDWVDARYLITYTTVSTLDFVAESQIHKIRTPEGDYTAASIRTEYNTIKSGLGDASAEDFLRRFESRLRTRVEGDLVTAFPDATTRTLKTIAIDRSTLVASLPATTTVDYDITATITQDREKLGVSTLTDAQVTAAFEAGARFESDPVLVAEPGYNVTYVLTPPPGIEWASATRGTISPDGRALTSTLSNWRGATQSKAELGFVLYDKSAPTASDEVITTNVALSIPGFEVTNQKLSLLADVRGEVESLDVAKRFPTALPAKVTLDFVTADGVRKLKAAGLVKDAELASSEADILEEVTTSLRASLGQDASVNGGFDDASFASSAPSGSPLVFRATAAGGYKLEASNAEGKDVTSIFSAGASIEASFTLESDAGRTTSFTLTVAEPVEFASPTEGGVLSADKRSVTWTVDNENGFARLSKPVKVTLLDAEAKRFDAADAKISIVIDITDIDISVAKAAGGDFGNLLIDVGVDGELGVLKIPDDLRAKLPESIKLEYLSSDAIRALYRDGLITNEDVDKMDQEILSQLKEKISSALGGNPNVVGGLDRASLDAKLIATPLASDKPVEFGASLHVTKSLAGGGDPNAQAAIALYTVRQTFSLPQVDDFVTTYKVILPKGLAVAEATATNGNVQTGKEGGRDYFIVTPSGGGAAAETSVAMAITPTFVMAKFWPIVLAAVLLVVLIVATPIALVVRSRRKKAKAKAAPAKK